MERQPATIDEVRKIVEIDLADCDVKQQEIFQKFSVQPYLAPIYRYENLEKVVVVGRKENAVMYWEDVEEGFNVSPTDPDGRILEHWCNQDELKYALIYWMEGEDHPPRCGPAEPIK